MAGEIQGHQILIEKAHDSFHSKERDSLNTKFDLLERFLDAPFRVTFSSPIITIGASDIVLKESNGKQGELSDTSDIFTVSPQPDVSHEVIGQSTLDLSTGAITGNFEAIPFCPTIPANNYIWVGVEMIGNIWFIRWGLPSATLGGATKVTFSNLAKRKLFTVLCQKNNTIGTWGLTADVSDFIVFESGGAGGSSTLGEGGDDYLVTRYKMNFRDGFETSDFIDDTQSTGEFTFVDQGKINLDWSIRAFTKSGNDLTLLVAPTYTMKVGDVVRQGDNWSTITAVTDQTHVTVASATLLVNGNATFTQCITTRDLMQQDTGLYNIDKSDITNMSVKYTDYRNLFCRRSLAFVAGTKQNVWSSITSNPPNTYASPISEITVDSASASAQLFSKFFSNASFDGTPINIAASSPTAVAVAYGWLVQNACALYEDTNSLRLSWYDVEKLDVIATQTISDAAAASIAYSAYRDEYAVVFVEVSSGKLARRLYYSNGTPKGNIFYLDVSGSIGYSATKAGRTIYDEDNKRYLSVYEKAGSIWFIDHTYGTNVGMAQVIYDGAITPATLPRILRNEHLDRYVVTFYANSTLFLTKVDMGLSLDLIPVAIKTPVVGVLDHKPIYNSSLQTYGWVYATSTMVKSLQVSDVTLVNEFTLSANSITAIDWLLNTDRNEFVLSFISAGTLFINTFDARSFDEVLGALSNASASTDCAIAFDNTRGQIYLRYVNSNTVKTTIINADGTTFAAAGTTDLFDYKVYFHLEESTHGDFHWQAAISSDNTNPQGDSILNVSRNYNGTGQTLITGIPTFNQSTNLGKPIRDFFVAIGGKLLRAGANNDYVVWNSNSILLTYDLPLTVEPIMVWRNRGSRDDSEYNRNVVDALVDVVVSDLPETNFFDIMQDAISACPNNGWILVDKLCVLKAPVIVNKQVNILCRGQDTGFLADPGTDEVQKISFSVTPNGGTFELNYNGTPTVSLAFSSTYTDVRTALETILGVGNVSVSGGFASGFSVTFTNAAGKQDQLQMSYVNNLTSGGLPISMAINTIVNGELPYTGIGLDITQSNCQLVGLGQIKNFSTGVRLAAANQRIEMLFSGNSIPINYDGLLRKEFSIDGCLGLDVDSEDIPFNYDVRLTDRVGFQCYASAYDAVTNCPDGGWLLVEKLAELATTLDLGTKRIQFMCKGEATGFISTGATVGIKIGADNTMLLGLGSFVGFNTAINLNNKLGTRIEMRFPSTSGLQNIDYGTLVAGQYNSEGSLGLEQNVLAADVIVSDSRVGDNCYVDVHQAMLDVPNNGRVFVEKTCVIKNTLTTNGKRVDIICDGPHTGFSCYLGTNSIQHIAFGDVPDAGTWKLQYNTSKTADMAFNANAATVKAQLEALSDITSVTVTGNYSLGFTVEFTAVDGLQPRSLIVIPAGVNEVQKITFATTIGVTYPTSGSFKLQRNGNKTVDIPYNATTVAIKAAIEALPDVGTGNISVTGDVYAGYSIEFVGSLAGIPQNTFTIPEGINEIQKITFSTPPTSGNWRLAFNGQNTGNLNWDATTNDIRSFLIALGSVDNVLVRGDYTNGFYVEFIGAVDGHKPQLAITVNANTLLTGSTPVSITIPTGGSSYQIGSYPGDNLFGNHPTATTLTFKDSKADASGFKGSCSLDGIIFVANGSNIRAYSTDYYGVMTLLSTFTTVSGNFTDVATDGTYIFAVTDNNHVMSFSWANNVLSNITDYSGADSYTVATTTTGHLIVGGTSGIRTFSIIAGALTAKDFTFTAIAHGLVGVGSNVYVAYGVTGLYSYAINPLTGAISVNGLHYQSGNYYDVWADSAYIHVAADDRLHSYLYGITTGQISYLATYNAPGSEKYRHIFGDIFGYIYASGDTANANLSIFNYATNYATLTTIALTDCFSVYHDGTWLYTGTSSDFRSYLFDDSNHIWQAISTPTEGEFAGNYLTKTSLPLTMAVNETQVGTTAFVGVGIQLDQPYCTIKGLGKIENFVTAIDLNSNDHARIEAYFSNNTLAIDYTGLTPSDFNVDGSQGSPFKMDDGLFRFDVVISDNQFQGHPYTTFADPQLAINACPDGGWILVNKMCLLTDPLTTSGKTIHFMFKGQETGFDGNNIVAVGIVFDAPNCSMTGMGTLRNCTDYAIDFNNLSGHTVAMFFETNGANAKNIEVGSLLDTQYNIAGSIGLADAPTWSNQTSFPMGFVESQLTNSAITLDDASRILTVQPLSSYTVWVKGVRKEITTVETCLVPNTSGLYWIWYDSTFTLKIANTPWNLSQHAPVAVVLWNANLGKGKLGEERHGASRNYVWHARTHATLGTQYVNGHAINGFTLNTHSDAAVSFGLAGGKITDEDILLVLNDTAPYNIPFHQNIAYPAQLEIWYRENTATGDWAWDTASSLPIKHLGGIPQWQDVSANFAQTPVTDGYFFNVWTLTTNFHYGTDLIIQSQAQFLTQTEAEAEDFDSLQFGTFPAAEMAALYRTTYQYNVGSGGTTNCQMVINPLDIRGSKNPNRGAGGGTSANHNAMAGRNEPNAHAALAVSTEVTQFATTLNESTALNTSTDDVQKSLVKLSDRSDVATQVMRQNANKKLKGGGDITWNGTQLSTASDMYLEMEGLPDVRNTIQSLTTFAIADGAFLYVTVNRTGSSAANLTPVAGTVPFGDDIVVIGRRLGTKLFLENIVLDAGQIGSLDLFTTDDKFLHYNCVVTDTNVYGNRYATTQAAINACPDNGYILVEKLETLNSALTTAGKTINFIFKGMSTGWVAGTATTAITLGASGCRFSGLGRITGFLIGINLGAFVSNRIEMYFTGNTTNISGLWNQYDAQGSSGLGVAHVQVGTNHGDTCRWDNVNKRYITTNFINVSDAGSVMLGAVSSSQMHIANGYAKIVSPTQTTIAGTDYTFDCNTQHIFLKTGTTGTVNYTLGNLSVGQTVNIVVSTTGGSRTINWYCTGATMHWNSAIKPTPTTTASRYDVYTFIKLSDTMVIGVGIMDVATSPA